MKELRNKAGLSQRDPEKLSNISNAEISRIETATGKSHLLYH
ncbi:MAG: helix-turn-helix transcriptional regulator [Dehalobacterium sp.]